MEVIFADRTVGQPGTVIFVEGSSCVPPQCGDNSTSFDLMIGNILLERLSTANTTLRYVGRFPDFRGASSPADIQVITPYQVFTLPVFITFTLFDSQPIDSVTPNMGQRGTNVILRGDDLLGVGRDVTLSSVSLGGTDVVIVDGSDRRMIRVRASSGMPGVGGVQINTTQEFEGMMYNGPYTFMGGVWTQLLDGNITNLVPLAAQLGREVLLCGSRLLGGGTSVDSVQHNNNTFTLLQPLPILSSSISVPGPECLQVQLPGTLQGARVDSVTITSDTGSIVTSALNFSIANIDSVSPSRGQAGTTVSIRGLGLLSGFESVQPTVFLSGVLAIVMSSSNSEIVVRAGTPANPQQVVGVSGGVLIEVTSPFNASVFFNVSSNTGWQYEEDGQVDTAVPNFGQFGTLLTINGSNLLAYGTGLTHATVDGVNATVLDGATSSLVRLRVPDIRNRTGPVDITLFSDTGARVRGSNIFALRERGVVLNAVPSQGQNGTLGKIFRDRTGIRESPFPL